MNIRSLMVKNNRAWIYIGLIYGIVSVLLINFSLYRKISQGIFTMRTGYAKFIIDIIIICVCVLVSIIGYFGYYIFSFVCFIGFSCGTIVFLAYTFCKFCGLEFVFSMIILFYIDFFALALGTLSQIVYEYKLRK